MKNEHPAMSAREARKNARERKKALDKEYSLKEPLNSSDKKLLAATVIFAVAGLAVWAQCGIF